MRLMLPFTVTAVLAASAVKRYVPPGVVVNISHISLNVTHIPGDGAGTPLSLEISAGPDKSLNGHDTKTPLADSASDELWYKHMRKGNSLNCGMCGTDAGAGYQIGDTRTPPSAASKWVGGIIETIDWYWWEGSTEPAVCDMDRYWGMGSTFQGLGISPKSMTAGGDLQCFQLLHANENAKYPDGTLKPALAQSYTVEGKMYHATDASHYFSMGVQSGVIIGIALLGPEISSERLWGWKPAPDQLPKLRNLSDLYWAYWSSLNHAAGSRVDNLNKYIVYSIQNAETDQIIARAMRSIGKQDLEAWTGHYFPTTSEQGLALLGSPIGATIGYLLMQHKKELGNKYISGIRVLRGDDSADDNDRGADLVFEIENVPAEESIPDTLDQDSPQDRPASEGLITPKMRSLTLRDTSGISVEEHRLGPNNILRVHAIKAY